MSTQSPMSGTPIDAAEIMALDREFVMGTYARQPIVFVRGEGVRLWDSEGREYLDFLGGIAVVLIGHCHPRLAGAIAEQAHTLMHVSNLFHNAHQAPLAKRLCGLTGMEKVFFCNSGAEANECALKIARKHGKAKGGEECFEIITFEGSFHGRTMGTVTATAQPKYQKPFAPLVPGFRYAPMNDLAAVRSLVSDRTCAVMIEPIRGESGVLPASTEFVEGLRALCDQSGALLIFDEIQSGMGRTGRFLASQTMGVTGDIVTLAKGIAGGFPMGACLAKGEAAVALVPGDHGSTFAGQALACAASLATLDVLEEEHLITNASAVGDYFRSGLASINSDLPGRIKEIRGLGLMVGVELGGSYAKSILQELLSAGIVANAVGDTILRFVPPLVVTREDCDRVVEALRTALRAAAPIQG